LLAALVVVAGAVWATSLAWHGGARGTAGVRGGLIAAWALAGAYVARRKADEPMGALVLAAAAVATVAALGDALWRHGNGGTAADLVSRLVLGLLPAAGLRIVLGVPDGALARRSHRNVAIAAYVVGAAVGLALWAPRPHLPLWPVALEGVLALAIGLPVSNSRYRRSQGTERRRMQWFGWGVSVTAELVLVVLALRILADWPPHWVEVAAAMTIPLPVGLALGASRKLLGRVDRLLAHTVSLAGLSGVVVATYLVIVLGLGRVPSHRERTLLLLSMLAAGVAAVLYLPARERLARFSNRLVYGERHAPDEVLRTFGSRLTRAIPLDELLLQLAESLRTTLALSVVEVWTGSGGLLERSASVPERGQAKLSLGGSEEPVVARAGVSGPAWIKVWLPALLEGREDRHVRVAPITHSGELLGLVLIERGAGADPFTAEDERVLTELSRQVGLALHNVRLDSALQASLDEVRRQASELQASRARIVATADQERRRIERNLHDGAQQHLVALAVKLRLTRQLADADVDQAKVMLDELSTDLQDAVQELRNLAHGIYPPLLMDRGLSEALTAAAGRAALPTDVHADGIGRYPSDVEAAVYFCCLEAMQNAGKHAGDGATITVRVWVEEGGLLFEVADDGAGFDMAARGTAGAGFINMSDRLGAIGGNVRVESAPGAGTRVSGRIPVSGLSG
jgi:signal transduction histidine kinase